VNPASIPELHGKEAPGWIKTEAYMEGGMFSYYYGAVYPRKGHPYPEAIYANNIVKRLFLTLVMPLADKAIILPALGFLLVPFKYKIRLIEKQLLHFSRFALYVLRPHLLQKIFYNNCSREVWDFTERFLTQLGVSKDIAHNTGEIIATLLEYDDAYRYRFEDMMTETNPKALQNPRKELTKLIRLFHERDNISEVSAGGKFIALAKILSFILLVPRVKKAFLYAVNQSSFQNLQLDDIDRFYCINRIDYKYFGYEITERLIKYVENKTLITESNHLWH